MRLTPLKIFAVAAMLSTVAVVTASRAAGDPTLTEIAAYKSWTPLNSEPIKIEGVQLALA